MTDSPPITRTYLVAGMSCGHCVVAVTDELSRIDGVIRVEVDLASGRVDVQSSGPLDDALVSEAIDDAGYEIVS